MWSNSEIESANSKLTALENLVRGIDLTKRLPGQVFRGTWFDFYFMESDHLFAPKAMSRIRKLLSEDEPDHCCMLNLDEIETDVTTNPIYMVDRSTSDSEFNERLYLGGPASAWMYPRQRFGFSSKSGDWCIYCERINDLAVIAFRHSSGSSKYAEAISGFYAKPLKYYIENPSTEPLPYNDLLPEWPTLLEENYRV